MNRIFLSLIGLMFCAGSAQAQQFVAVKVEAESFASKHSDWRLTSTGNTPNVNPDPDGSHAGSASGRAYLELLPDTRVTHGDPLIGGRNFWNEAGTGPSLSYNVNIPEAGRYIVFVKAYSTGTEDNGIHVGLNNTNPDSGQRIQWCGGKNKWTWSSAQRTNSNHCGVERTIYLDFSFAGANTVTFSAREDGFEFDQFILLKSSNNSCRPNDNDQIACNNGTTSVSAQTPTTTPEPLVMPEPVVIPEPVVVPEPIVIPEPVVVPEPVVIAEPVVQPASLPATATTLAVCERAASDQDGDGYGWENNSSCIVAPSVSTASAQPAASTGAFAACQSAASDPDGDGYGWENNNSCVAGSATVSAAPAVPACQSASSDDDGDGWGWENSQSCVVQ